MYVEERLAFINGVSLLGFESMSQDIDNLSRLYTREDEENDVDDLFERMFESLMDCFDVLNRK